MKRLDEVTAARRKRRRKYHLRRLTAALFALAAVLLIVLAIGGINMYTFRDIGDFFAAAFAKEAEYPLMLESAKALKALELKNAFAVLTGSELIVKGSRGGELLRVGHNLNYPVMQANGARILLYDSGNRVFSVYNRTSRLFADESEYPIIAGAIASDGAAVILTRGDRTTAQLRVLSGKSYTTLFTWYGARGFPYGCGIAENGREAYVLTSAAAGGGITTTFTLIDVPAKEQRAEIRLDGIVLKVYEAGSKYIAVTDKGAFLINKEKVEAAYPFSKVPVLDVSKEGGLLAVAFGDNRQPDINFILILTEKLEEVRVIEGPGPVDDIYMRSDKLLLLSQGRVYVILQDGETEQTYETQLRAQKVFWLSSRVHVLLPDRVEKPPPAKDDVS